MVKCKTYGRMGNFLFQVATTIGYALDHSLEFTVPNTTNDDFHNPIYLQHLVNPQWDPHWEQVLVCEDGHQHQEIPFREEWRNKNIILDGYWQSEKYFAHHRGEVLRLFRYPYVLKNGFVSVHVRRGDYVHLTKKHPPVPMEWYRAAMEHFVGFTFVIFSDDIPWCKEQDWGTPHIKFATGQSIETDLVQMSHCEHNISSASTFGWWGAWLNRNPKKKVIIPKRWFTAQEEAKLCTKDIVPERWTRL